MESKNAKPKICILFCGGTIVMSPDPKTGALDVAGGTETIMNLEPGLRNFFDLNVIFIDNIDSSNMTVQHWDKMVNVIAENYDEHDGFVITHGTNTLGYTAAALSFALGDIGKPVVLTGAQIPLGRLDSDARHNFVNAVKLASMDLAGVYTVFGSKIIRGTRTKKDNESSLDAFKTFNSTDAGTIGIQIKLNGPYKRRHDRKLKPRPGFDAKIVVLTAEPGMSNEYLNLLIENGVQGLVIRAYGAGDLPSHVLPALQKAHSKKIPVVITTQCPNGVTQMGLNAVGLYALN
ncbi:MAG: asparaginase, partial [Candidatus Micrarchaeota archaeon]